MRAMILAAGRGERMRPLTDTRPKSMLSLQGRPIIQHHVEHLVNANIRDIVINYGRFGDQIESFLGDGTEFGARVHYSPEHGQLLDTGGGIRRVLPQLGEEPFLVINADIWTDYDLSRLSLADDDLALLVMVDNPPYHPEGDFVLEGDRLVTEGGPKLTFSGLGIYRPALFRRTQETSFPLGPLLREAMSTGKIAGEHFRGRWIDIGTPERLLEAQSLLEQ
ncbi:MAG TPA: nucleotidyltransferase family protein [Gammaproteobacteria bacterium]|nr:nucleotidyltransferase family protein [Gammaproteobacteria bacterium]